LFKILALLSGSELCCPPKQLAIFHFVFYIKNAP
jgi:hypothetical protein